MKPAPRIGVALCTYNGAQFLQAQLDSVLAQTLAVDEVVVGDDGSSDATLSLLADFSHRAEARGIRVEIVQHARNLGYVLNFSDALKRCSAEVIFLSDQDDVWHPDRVELCVRRFDAEPSLLMLHGDACLVDAAGEPLGASLLEVLHVHPAELALEREGRVVDAILVRNFITGATCALRRSLLADSLPVPARWSHDEWLAVNASLLGGLDVTPRATIDYRQHGGNQIGASRRSFLYKFRGVAVFDAQARQRTAERLDGLAAFLSGRGVTLAPARWRGLSALAWRMAASRLQLYRRSDVGWRWMAHDAPRLVARIVNACVAGAGWRGVAAACHGAWAGLRGRA